MNLSNVLVVFAAVGCILAANAAPRNEEPKWNDVKITFPASLEAATDAFDSMPKTEDEASRKGWKKEKDCSKVNGNRYIKDKDLSAILIFNAGGHLAGFATFFPKNFTNLGVPSEAQKEWMTDDGEYYTISSYFTDPDTVCKSREKPSSKYIGDKLVFKGSKITKEAPQYEADAEEFWTLGKCFPAMGVHYWGTVDGQKLVRASTRGETLPLFLMYNQGRLNGYGYALDINLESRRYEHPTPVEALAFFKEVPEWIDDRKDSLGLSTLHVYLTSTPEFNFC